MTTFTVSNSAQLVSAFNAAQGGDRIELAAGVYDYTRLTNRQFATDITITSADPNHRAVFGTMLGFNNVAGVNVTDIDLIEQQLPKNPKQGLLNVWYSRDVTFSDIRIQGHLPTAAEGVDPRASGTSRLDVITGYGYGSGIRLTNNSDITITNVEISDFFTAVIAGDLFDSKMTGMDIHDVREGIDIYDIDTVEISGSYFHDFKPWVFGPGGMQDHPDMIQYWGSNSSFGVHDLTIDNNLFYQPTGWTQSIFGHMRNAPTGVTATGFTITDNVIVNGHTNAIRTDNVDGFTIANNLILPNSLSPNSSTGWPRIFLVDDTNGSVTGNVLVNYWNNTLLNLDDAQLAQANVTASGNLGLSRGATAPDYWGSLLSEALNIYHAGGSYVTAATTVLNAAAPPAPDLVLTVSHDGPSGTGHWVDADGSGTLTAGDTVTFTYKLDNTGNVALTGISLSDDLTGIAATQLTGLSDTDGDGQADDLAKGATATATASYVMQAGDAGTTLTLHARASSSATAPDTAVTSLAVASGSGGSGGSGTGTVTGHLESGTIAVSQSNAAQWHAVSFSQDIANARVVMGPLSYNGSDQAGVRVRNVTDQGFEFQIDEWDYYRDGKHGPETVSWVAVSAGTHTLASGQVISAGRISATDSIMKGVALSGFATTPAIFAQVSSANGGQAVTSRISSVSESGFSVHMQEEEANDGIHTSESIDWLAIDYGTTGETDVASIARVTEAWRTVHFDAFSDEFAFIAAMQTETDIDPAVLRYDGLTADSARIFVEEETSKDAAIAHSDEQVAYLTLSTGVVDLYA